jgi:putative transcriptional regulator
MVIIMKILLNNILSKQNKTMYWLSQQTGLAYSTIFNICNNKTSRIEFAALEKICIALSCTPNDILKIEDNT